MKIGRRRRLQLHRETLRVLEADQLRRAAGGDLDYEGHPKSNAWTGQIQPCHGPAE